MNQDLTQNTAAEDSGQVDFEFLLGAREICFNVDETLYPLDAIYGAAYVFIDRCYVFLSRPADHKVAVRLRGREASGSEQLEALAGEFANELLNQALRARISESTVSIRDYYMARAFQATGRSQATIDQLLAELDEEELAEDSLKIAVPWEKQGG